jgi:hypothetical protein
MSSLQAAWRELKKTTASGPAVGGKETIDSPEGKIEFVEKQGDVIGSINGHEYVYIQDTNLKDLDVAGLTKWIEETHYDSKPPYEVTHFYGQHWTNKSPEPAKGPTVSTGGDDTLSIRDWAMHLEVKDPGGEDSLINAEELAAEMEGKFECGAAADERKAGVIEFWVDIQDPKDIQAVKEMVEKFGGPGSILSVDSEPKERGNEAAGAAPAPVNGPGAGCKNYDDGRDACLDGTSMDPDKAQSAAEPKTDAYYIQLAKDHHGPSTNEVPQEVLVELGKELDETGGLQETKDTPPPALPPNPEALASLQSYSLVKAFEEAEVAQSAAKEKFPPGYMRVAAGNKEVWDRLLIHDDESSAMGKPWMKYISGDPKGEAEREADRLFGQGNWKWKKDNNLFGGYIVSKDGDVIEVTGHNPPAGVVEKGDGPAKGAVTAKKWSHNVSPEWHPKEGFFKQSAEKIAEGLKRGAKDLKQAMSRLNFYINRAGGNLSAEDKKKLENAKEKLHSLYGSKSSAERSYPTVEAASPFDEDDSPQQMYEKLGVEPMAQKMALNPPKPIREVDLGDGNVIKIVQETHPSHRGMIGIHLEDPEERDIEDAIEQAEKDGFEYIFVNHSPRVNNSVQAAEESMEKEQRDAMVEALAAVAHEQWLEFAESVKGEVSEELKTEWEPRMVPYDQLDDGAKEQDREWAEEILMAVEPFMGEGGSEEGEGAEEGVDEGGEDLLPPMTGGKVKEMVTHLDVNAAQYPGIAAALAVVEARAKKGKGKRTKAGKGKGKKTKASPEHFVKYQGLKKVLRTKAALEILEAASGELVSLEDEMAKLEDKHESELTPADKKRIEELGKQIESLKNNKAK